MPIAFVMSMRTLWVVCVPYFVENGHWPVLAVILDSICMHGIIQDCTSYVHNVRRGGGYLSIMVATSNTYMYVHTYFRALYVHTCIRTSSAFQEITDMV